MLFLVFNKASVSNDIWIDYYGLPSETPNTITNNSALLINKNFFLLDSKFHDISNSAINCTTNYVKLLHSKCTYINITKNFSYGGSIYFQCNSSIVQDRFCAIKCFARSGGMHSFTNVNDAKNKNFVNLSSINECGRNNTGTSSIYHNYGEKTLISTNITRTICYGSAGYSFYYKPVNVSYCCFNSNDNHYEYRICMEHCQNFDAIVKRSLFKNNTCHVSWSSYCGVITCIVSDLTVIECIFLENTAHNTIGSGYLSKTRIIHCYVDNYSVGTYWGENSITTDEPTTEWFNIVFSQVALGECDALKTNIYGNKIVKTKLNRAPSSLMDMGLIGLQFW